MLAFMGATRWLSAREQTVWRAYLDSTRLLIRALDRQLEADAGISFTDYELLVHLSEAPQRRLRMRDLADVSLASRSGVTRAVSRLEELGWVERVPCEDDHRGMQAELTAAGRHKLARVAPGHVAAVRANLFDLLSTNDLARLGDVSTTIRTHLVADA